MEPRGSIGAHVRSNLIEQLMKQVHALTEQERAEFFMKLKGEFQW
jgi:hypothetical protein